MSANSPNLSDQFKKMQAEAATLEQTIQHRKSEVQAVQKKFDDLHTETNRQTSQLLAEQADILKKARIGLLTEQASIKEQIEKQTYIVSRNKSEIQGYKDAVTELNEVISGIHYEIKGAETKLDAVKAENRERTSENSRLEVAKQLAQSEIADLESDKDAIHTAITESEALKMRLIEDIQSLEAEYARDKKTKDENLALMDAKVLAAIQSLDVTQEKERLIRADLASWQQRLEEQDKNLRVRELKVNQGENKLIQNAGLLNL